MENEPNKSEILKLFVSASETTQGPKKSWLLHIL